jgi:hypothetical protein
MKYRAMMRQKRKGNMLPAARVERHQNVTHREMGRKKSSRVMSKVTLTSSAMGALGFLTLV